MEFMFIACSLFRLKGWHPYWIVTIFSKPFKSHIGTSYKTILKFIVYLCCLVIESDLYNIVKIYLSIKQARNLIFWNHCNLSCDESNGVYYTHNMLGVIYHQTTWYCGGKYSRNFFFSLVFILWTIWSSKKKFWIKYHVWSNIAFWQKLHGYLSFS